MSNARKLQTEIDRTLKKVEEGIDVFDDIWDKVYNADQQSQKEKYESDLKKEIKKLQRLRDQIKGWLSQSDIKDKSNLLDSRKLIETKMEQFKICERDTKTKAYSKEGLARAATLGPEDAAKEEKRSWLNDCIDKLSELVESLEADVEKLSAGRGRVKNKDSIEKNERRVKKNQWHRTRMEQIIRLLDCDEIDPSSLDSIKDDVDYYVESAPEDDGVLGVEDEFDIYEDLGLDSRGSGLAGKTEEEDAKEPVANASKETKTATKKKSISSIDAGMPVIGKATPVKKGDKDTSPIKAKGVANGGVTLSKMMTSAGGNTVSPVKSSGTTSTTSTISASKDKKGRDGDSNREQQPATSWAAAMQKGNSSQSSTSASTAASASSANNAASDTSASALQQNNNNNNSGQDSQASSGDQRGKTYADTSGQSQSQFQQQQQQQQQQQRHPALDQNLLSRPELQVGLSLLQQSMKYTPVDDIERFGTYKPRNPHPTHRLYPAQPPAIIQSGRVFDKLPMDTLFFAFYQQQGTYQQYLAAKQLKKLSWRFNKKYMTWFQRHEEPKITTKEYEQGTYVYFDYESGWCQRIKSDFKFEYCHLEDELDVQAGPATGTQPQQNR